MSKSREYLGVGTRIEVFLLFLLPPIWVLICITSYLKLNSRVVLLKKEGVRSN
ncbi:unnamed protein product, partial [marine sediment metagenome]